MHLAFSNLKDENTVLTRENKALRDTLLSRQVDGQVFETFKLTF